MKIKTLAVTAISALMLASCGSGASKLSEKATPVDSLSYTLGEMGAMQRAMSFQQDSTLSSKSAQADFDKGFEKGFDLLKKDNEAYNTGLLLGLQMAMQMNDLAKNSDITLDRGLVLGGYNGAKTDSLDTNAYQKIQERGARLVSSIMAEKVKVKVDEAAKKEGYKAKEGVYMKEHKAGNGTLIKAGQTAQVKINIMDTKHRELIPNMKEQAMPYTAGDGNLPFLDKTLPMLSEGSVVEILASPQQAFGAQMPPMVDAKEPVLITVEVVGIGEAAADSTATAAPAPGAPVQVQKVQ